MAQEASSGCFSRQSSTDLDVHDYPASFAGGCDGLAAVLSIPLRICCLPKFMLHAKRGLDEKYSGSYASKCIYGGSFCACRNSHGLERLCMPIKEIHFACSKQHRTLAYQLLDLIRPRSKVAVGSPNPKPRAGMRGPMPEE
eukprot:5574218-Pleurochrysis_carterae.AAC.6